MAIDAGRAAARPSSALLGAARRCSDRLGSARRGYVRLRAAPCGRSSRPATARRFPR